jgi:hypothetical protein
VEYPPVPADESDGDAWTVSADPALAEAPAPDPEDVPRWHQPAGTPAPDPAPALPRTWMAAVLILLAIMVGELTYITGSLIHQQIEAGKAAKEIDRARKEFQKALDQLP